MVGLSVQVMSALHMIMQKWKNERSFRDNADIDPEHVQLRMLMLGKLCGAVIGEGGKTINEIKMATNTEIRVQARSCTSSVGSALRRSGWRAALGRETRSRPARFARRALQVSTYNCCRAWHDCGGHDTLLLMSPT